MVCAGVVGSVSGPLWGALRCLGVAGCRCVPQSANGWRVTIYCVRVCLCPRGWALLPRPGPQDTPQPLLSLRRGCVASPYPGTSPSLPALPCLLQLPLPRGHRARLCLPAKSPRVSGAGRWPGSQAGCHLRTERWGTLGRKLAEPQDLRGHGRGAGDWPGGPETEKAPAGAGEEGGRLGAGAGGNWHRTHGPAR